jgi:competence ComEA-like helix-hairpin-helix protein
VLLAGVFVYVLVARYFLPLYLAEPIGVIPQATAADPGTTAPAFVPADQRVDPNTATWTELDRLPGIGELTAKSIVDYREKHRSATGEPVFRTAEDLERVRGIGPKTVEQIRSGLKLPDPASDSQPSAARKADPPRRGEPTRRGD